MTEKMELAFDVQKIPIFMLMIIVKTLPGVAGLIISNTTATVCDGSTANINFAVDLQNGTIPSGSEIWYFEATTIATRSAEVFFPHGNYANRLHSYSTYGLALDNITAADGGRYLFVFSYYSPSPQGFETATSTLTVKVAPTDSCIPSYRQSGALAICELDPSANCGSPRLEPMWINTSGNTFTVTKAGTYTCCANGSILMDCYHWSSSFCKTFQVAGTTTTTTTTLTSSSTSISSATSSVTIDKTSSNITTSESSASATSTTSTSMSPTSVSPASNTNNTSTSTKPTLLESTTTNNTTSNKRKNINTSSDTNIKVIVPAVVVPCGLLIVGGIILVVCCVRHRTGKNFCESPDGMVIQDKGNNIEGWKQSQGHGKATDNLDAVYTTPDGFILYPGREAMSTTRSYKDKKHLDVTDQYNIPNVGPYHHQAEYFPRTYTSARAYTHKDKKHHGVTGQCSRPYTRTYGYQAGYVPSTYKSGK